MISDRRKPTNPLIAVVVSAAFAPIPACFSAISPNLISSSDYA
jgi:hypothetical protein